MFRQLQLLDDGLPAVADSAEMPLAVRQSRRARRLILQVVPPHTLELVVPVGTRPKVVEAFVRDHADWIDRARSQIATHYVGDRAELPSRIVLPAIDKQIDVTYQRQTGQHPKLASVDGGLEIHADRAGDVQKLLRQWLLNVGRNHLKPWLLDQARRTGYSPRTVQVRLQRTRWGSCSAQGTISLNANALFAHADAVRYLMVHELSHLRVMNHSRRFWRAVERFEPNWKALDNHLANSWTRVPLWALGDRRQG